MADQVQQRRNDELEAEVGEVRQRPPYGFAALMFLAVLGLYVITVAPTTQFWDTSEYIAAAKVLGIPHPPGNPLFVLLAHVWGMIPLVEHYALRINLLAAVTSALASGFLFLVAERFLRDLIPTPRWARLASAAAGVLVGATAFTVWNQSVVNEKVYTLSLFSIALVLWLVVHWGDEPPGQRRDHWLLLIVYLVALSMTNHQMGLLVGPALLVYVLFTDPRALLRWRLWVAGVLVVAVGISVFGFLPIRAGFYPAINEGEPTCSSAIGALQSIFTMGISGGCEALSDVLSREQYQKGPLIPRQADLFWQYANYVQYFGWQFAHDWAPPIRRVFAVLFGALGLLGAVRHWQRDRRGAVAMIALMFTVIVALVFYLDFKYGFSIRPGENLLREVRERDYFFIASFQLWGVWVALGFGVLLGGIAEFLRARIPTDQRWVFGTPVLLLALIPMAGNHQTASRAGERLPRDFAWDMLQSVEPYAILVTTGDNDTFPLWYMQEVEGVRRDVLIANTSLMNTRWHGRQLKRRQVDPFDTENAIALYRDSTWTAPTEDALSMSYDELDALPVVFPVRERSSFRVGNLRAVIEPQVLERAHLLTLRLIEDNLGERPIYISRTTGGLGEQLGLTPHLLGQGMVRKVVEQPIQAGPTVASVPTMGWVDIPRTERLLFDVYHAQSAAWPRPQGWVDRPSEGIISLYSVLYATYARWLAMQQSDTTAAPDSLATERLLRATQIAQDVFRQTAFGRQQ
jgi:hypothetical protein